MLLKENPLGGASAVATKVEDSGEAVVPKGESFGGASAVATKVERLSCCFQSRGN